MRYRELLLALAVCVGFWAAPQGVLAQCTTDADCNDGVFCNGIESCDTASSACVAVSACPPSIDGCVTRNAFCDEENARCVDFADDSQCDDGVFCNGIESCDTASGGCVAISACPPFINGCLVGGACDEQNDVCLATPDDSLCPAGQVCKPSGDCVSPVDIIPNLIGAVESLAADGVLNGGQANSLITKLNGALRKLDLGQINVACGLLRSFINQVTDLVQEDGVLTEEQGQPLIESAARVRNALGCPEADGS